MQAMIFVRRSGAFGLGHVGWAYQYPGGTYEEGSVENLSGAPVDPPGQNGFWRAVTQDPFAQMQWRNYDAYKVLSIDPSYPSVADSTVAWLAQQYYVAVGLNCEDFTYDALRSYGADLPWPLLHLAPNNWFDAVDAAEMPMPAVAPLAVPPPQMPTGPIGAPRAPAWRQIGTPEWIEFERARSTGTLRGEPPLLRSATYERKLQGVAD